MRKNDGSLDDERNLESNDRFRLVLVWGNCLVDNLGFDNCHSGSAFTLALEERG